MTGWGWGLCLVQGRFRKHEESSPSPVLSSSSDQNIYFGDYSVFLYTSLYISDYLRMDYMQFDNFYLTRV